MKRYGGKTDKGKWSRKNPLVETARVENTFDLKHRAKKKG